MAEVTGSRVFDAPLDAVVAMLRDADATVAKYVGQGHEQVEVVEHAADDDSMTIVTTRVVTVDLPGFARKVLKPTNSMRQTDTWQREADGSWRGQFEVEVSGAPLRLHGTMTLRPDGERTVEEVTIRVDVKVPLVGGKIADWAAGNDVRRTLDAELDFNERWLAEHR